MSNKMKLIMERFNKFVKEDLEASEKAAAAVIAARPMVKARLEQLYNEMKKDKHPKTLYGDASFGEWLKLYLETTVEELGEEDLKQVLLNQVGYKDDYDKFNALPADVIAAAAKEINTLDGVEEPRSETQPGEEGSASAPRYAKPGEPVVGSNNQNK